MKILFIKKKYIFCKSTKETGVYKLPICGLFLVTSYVSCLFLKFIFTFDAKGNTGKHAVTYVIKQYTSFYLKQYSDQTSKL